MILRTATLDDVARMLDWAAQEGWNPGMEDAAAFHSADSKGFFVADVDGQMVAAISVVNHSDVFAFLGLYICLPDFRGQGVGVALWKHALQHAGSRTVGLDGVAEQQGNYARSGFVAAGSTMRFEGIVPSAETSGIRPVMGAQDTAQIAGLDLAANGFTRQAFLTGWIQDSPTRKTVVLEHNGQITGYATARLCREGCKIGPVIAPDQAAAESLIAAAVTGVGAHWATIDVPADQTGFTAALAGLGFVSGFATARMYRGPAPTPAQPQTLFGVATLELG